MGDVNGQRANVPKGQMNAEIEVRKRRTGNSELGMRNWECGTGNAKVGVRDGDSEVSFRA